MEYKYTLVDAQGMHLNHPSTFQVPSDDELRNLKVGYFVKIGVEFPYGDSIRSERFWCNVKEILSTGDLDCLVWNDLVFSPFHGLSFSKTIKVQLKNIYSIDEQ